VPFSDSVQPLAAVVPQVTGLAFTSFQKRTNRKVLINILWEAKTVLLAAPSLGGSSAFLAHGSHRPSPRVSRQHSLIGLGALLIIILHFLRSFL
jgi:hypothetical protein